MKEGATSAIPAEVKVGQATIELLSRQDRFPGLGKITVNGVTIRSATVPLRPDIMTPDGIRYDSFRLDDVQADGADVVLLTTAFGRQGLFGEYRDEYDSQLAWPRVEGGPFEDTVEWRLKPEQLTLDGVQYDGFSYALSFRSDQRSIHQITMKATWELGGSASGNTLLSQGQVNPPVYYCETDTDFTTTCWRQLGQAGNPHGVSFQFSSRYSPMQCFDFQYGPEGALLGYWPEFVDVHSMIQKNKGEDVVFVLDKCLQPLGRDLTFPRKCILLAPPPPEGAQVHLMHDRWLRALQHAQGVVRAAFDVNTPYLLPECGLAYRPELDDDGKLLIYIAGKPYAPENALAGWAEHLPALAAAGVRRVFPEPMGESDISENGYTYKLQSGIHGDLVTSSTCNCWRYRMAEFWGGWAAWEAFYAAGKAAGLEVGQWVGGQLSPNAPIFKEHPEFMCRAVNTRPHSGGPIINVTWGLNWNAACDWLLESFAEWKRHGLDYVFFDSIGNFAMMGVDYQAGMQPNTAGVARFIGGLNKMGVKAISNEGIGPMGVGRFGMADNITDNPAATHAVAGQNDWSWWVGHEDMLVGTLPMVHIHPSRTEQQVKEQCFRALANYSLLMLGEHEEGMIDQWPSNLDVMTSYYHTFNQVKSLMETRRLLPDDHGVEWQAEAGRALFAYAAFDYELPDSAGVERISGESATPEDARGMLRTEPYTIYRITGAPSSM